MLLLTDIETVFNIFGVDHLSTADLLKQLIVMEESPWAEWLGKPITSYSLAKFLRPFGVRPRTIRIGNQTPKGYRREDLIDAWARYTPNQSATPPHPKNEFDSGVSDSSENASVADTPPAKTHLLGVDSEFNSDISGKNVVDVADKTLESGREADTAQSRVPIPDRVPKL